MKKIKSIVLSVLLLVSLMIRVNVDANNNYETLNWARDDLIFITNGNLYIKVIDDFIEKKKQDTTRLEKLQSKLWVLQSKLENRNDKNSQTLLAIVNYLDIKITVVLTKDLVVKIIEEETQDESIIQNDKIEPSLTYPGFSDTYIEYDKTILAWEEVFVYKQSYSSLYEASEVWKVIFYITWADISEIKNSIESATLYLEWSIIDSVRSSQIDIISATQAKITFDNLDDFIITQNIRQARLKIKTANIGYQKVWKTIKDLYVSKVWFDDIKGLSSGQKLNQYDISEIWELFSIVPGTLEIKVEKNLSSNIPELNIRAMFENNSIEGGNNSPTIELSKLRLSTLGSTWDVWVAYSIYNSDSSWDRILWIVNWSEVEFDMSNLLQTNRTLSNSSRGEDYKIVITGTNTNTVITLNLMKWGVDYNVLWITGSNDIQINLEKELNLGSRNY